ncbi:hypothetical protein CFIICLFH_4536 [Methylobacterium goesingense]|nr:hypothetical protein CFIICLFH_4536 [Methylobacterium goesingense]
MAEVLAEDQVRAELVLEGVADPVLGLVEAGEARIAHVVVRRPEAGVVVEERRRRDVGDLEFAQEREGGVGGRLPGEGRGDVELVVVRAEPDEGAGLPPQAGESVGHGAVRPFEGAADVEGALEAVEAAGLELHLAEGDEDGALRRRVEDAAGRAEAVEAGGRPAQDRHRLQAVGLGLRVGEAAADHPQAVAVDALVGEYVEAADEDLVEARVEARPGGGGTGDVGHRIREGLDVAVVELLAGDHRDRLRRLDQRGVGLRRGRGDPRGVAGDAGGAAPAAAGGRRAAVAAVAAAEIGPAAAAGRGRRCALDRELVELHAGLLGRHGAGQDRRGQDRGGEEQGRT